MSADDVWALLITQAKDRAPCSSDGSTCHVRVIVGPLYALIQHTDLFFHVCAFCTSDVPEHMVSIETLQILQRDALIARVARFFSHCHAEQTSAPQELAAAA